MAQKKLVSRFICIAIILFFSSCSESKLDNIFNYEKFPTKLIEEYNDDAGVCKLKIYKLESFNDSSFERNMTKIDTKQIFPANNNGWKSISWSKKYLNKNVINFISPNFQKNELSEIVSKNKKYYSTYTYQGDIDEIFAIKLYVLLPEKKLVYYYEITP